MAPKVLISDKLSPSAVDIFHANGVDTDFRPGLSADDLLSSISDYDGLAIRSATKVTKAVLDRAPNLKIVGRAGIGVDNIDVNAATNAGIVVMNTPFGNSITTAEHAIALMMALARDLPAADRSTRMGKWEKSRFMGAEITGKTLGLIGCGNIGSIVATRAIGLCMHVIAFDPFLSEDGARELGVRKVELDELLAEADFVTLHTPLTEQTRNILSADRLAQMKEGVRLINCARGGLLDEEALAAELKSGRIRAAALDVFETEPARNSPLFELENVIVTPHLGAATIEAQEKVAEQIAQQMSAYLTSGAISNALNMPSVTAEEAPRLKPYMTLAEHLGSFAGQLTETGIRSVCITYCGHAASVNTKPLTQIILKGLLAPLLSSVNMVNAPSVARERNIELSTTHKEDAKAYQTLVGVSVETDSATIDIQATLFQDKEPRIVMLDGVGIEARVGSHMLYAENKDRPGFIGSIGQLLADRNINIATFHLGRDKVGGKAIALIEIDSEISDGLLSELSGLPNVVKIKRLQFSNE